MKSLIGMLFLMCWSLSVSADCGGPYSPVSMIGLIANPGEFDKKGVQIRGYFIRESSEKDLGYLYFSQDDLVRNVTENGVAITIPEKFQGRAKMLSGKSVVVQGVFVLDERGPWGLYAGSISCVNRFESDRDRSPEATK